MRQLNFLTLTNYVDNSLTFKLINYELFKNMFDYDQLTLHSYFIHIAYCIISLLTAVPTYVSFTIKINILNAKIMLYKNKLKLRRKWLLLSIIYKTLVFKNNNYNILLTINFSTQMIY